MVVLPFPMSLLAEAHFANQYACSFHKFYQAHPKLSKLARVGPLQWSPEHLLGYVNGLWVVHCGDDMHGLLLVGTAHCELLQSSLAFFHYQLGF